MAKQKQQQEEIHQELPQETQVEEPREDEEEQPEKLNRRESAQRVIAEVDGDTTLSELAEKADALYMAGRDAEPDPDSAAWYIQKILETLEGVGLVELRWECVIHPNVPRLGVPNSK